MHSNQSYDNSYGDKNYRLKGLINNKRMTFGMSLIIISAYRNENMLQVICKISKTWCMRQFWSLYCIDKKEDLEKSFTITLTLV